MLVIPSEKQLRDVRLGQGVSLSDVRHLEAAVPDYKHVANAGNMPALSSGRRSRFFQPDRARTALHRAANRAHLERQQIECGVNARCVTCAGWLSIVGVVDAICANQD
jgi:hypothetical protein